MTVLTTLVVCIALVAFGGEVIYGFSMAMLIGIAFGTYSSIYIAAPILIHTDIVKLQK
jgi:preprotein translocase subunit SecF